MDHCMMVRTFVGLRIWMAMGLLCWSCSESQPVEPPHIHCPHGPVIMVHGLGQGSAIFEDLVAALVRRGMPRECLHAIDYSDSNLPVRIAAEQELRPFIDGILAELEQAAPVVRGERAALKVNLIGHSMGALSSRWYATQIAPDRVKTWISTSGANHGTDWGCPQPAGTGHADMCPAFARSLQQSAVQYVLNGSPNPDIDETPYGIGRDRAGVETVAASAVRSILHLTVSVPDDAYIAPPKSLLIDGAGGVPLQLASGTPLREMETGNFRFVDPMSHDDILRSEDLADFISRAITAGHPQYETHELQ